jgi:hypothetical protein
LKAAIQYLGSKYLLATPIMKGNKWNQILKNG